MLMLIGEANLLTKVKKIFNKLMNIEKINKEGNGPQTRYILNKNNSDR